jgi:hypothetical protein
MVKIRASCLVIGDSFSPLVFAKLSPVRLVNANEPRDIGKRGRYCGMATPYGSAIIEVSDKAETEWSRFDDLLTVLESCIDALREAGAEDITLSCSLFHDGQCNFGFSQDEIRRIAALKVDFPISCYSDDLLPKCEK